MHDLDAAVVKPFYKKFVIDPDEATKVVFKSFNK